LKSSQVRKLKVQNYILLVIGCLAINSCIQSRSCFDEEIFCAALVTDTLGTEDYGNNQQTWLGLQDAKENKIVNQIAYIESVDTRDYQKNIDYFAQQGFDVILTSGIGLQSETLHSSDLYPDSVFIGLNQPVTESRPNLISITFPEDQMGFAAGALAAKISKTGIVAGVCETSGIDSMWRYCEGFRNGALFTNPQIKALIVYRDDGDRKKLFIDEAWGYETATNLIQRGADVVFAAGGVTGQGALSAATESNIYAIGTERDQASALGASGLGVVTSFRGQSRLVVYEMMRDIQTGELLQQRNAQIEFMPLRQNFSEKIGFELELLLVLLENNEFVTNVPLEKP
jgi:basic membrane lipoprotein Med (substrate-binding protein (PBP1-ABC) superfamily)